jgi:hypothetical protein
VAPTDPQRRTVLFSAVGAVLAAALLFAIVARVQSTNADSGGDGAENELHFDAGNAERAAADIARGGPRLFPDPQGRSRDIFVQHLGGTEWIAFEARAAGAPRQCTLRWLQGPRQFVDPCDGRMFPPNGAGLVTFPATVDEDGRVIVDLGSPTPPASP